MLLDRLHHFRSPALDTQKLCVRLRSIKAVLGTCRHRRHHFTLRPAQLTWAKHNLAEERDEKRRNPWVRCPQPWHTHDEPEVIRRRRTRRHGGLDLLVARQCHPGLSVGSCAHDAGSSVRAVPDGVARVCTPTTSDGVLESLSERETRRESQLLGAALRSPNAVVIAGIAESLSNEYVCSFRVRMVSCRQRATHRVARRRDGAGRKRHGRITLGGEWRSESDDAWLTKNGPTCRRTNERRPSRRGRSRWSVSVLSMGGSTRKPCACMRRQYQVPRSRVATKLHSSYARFPHFCARRAKNGVCRANTPEA